jgi:ParB-like chromosome segregation protein Spo0J
MSVTRTNEIRAVADLVPYAKNVKKHDDAQVAKIIESIQQFGWTQPIVIDEANVIIAGHGRRLAATKLSMTQVPVLVLRGLTDGQKRALRLADNRTNEGGIDTLMFREEILGIEELLTGIYDVKELEFSTADLGELNDAAFVPDVAEAVEMQEQAAHAKADEVTARRVPTRSRLFSKRWHKSPITHHDNLHHRQALPHPCRAQPARRGSR